MTMDLYAVLGVTRDASEDEIRAAARARTRELHPDLNPDAEAARMAEVNAAREILLDARRRERYDQTGFTGAAAPVEDEVSACLMEFAVGAIQQPGEDCVASARMLMKGRLIQISQTQASARMNIRKIEARLKRLRGPKDKPNPFAMILTEQMTRDRREIAEGERTAVVIGLALQQLDEFGFDAPEAPAPTLQLNWGRP